MKKTSFTPVVIGKAIMIPVARYYKLKHERGKESVLQSVHDAIDRFGAIYQGESDIRLGNGQFGKPHEAGYCNFLIPASEANDFNAHWDRLAEAAGSWCREL